MSQNIKCIPCDGVNDRQAVNFVFDEGVDGVKKAASRRDKDQFKKRHGTVREIMLKISVFHLELHPNQANVY